MAWPMARPAERLLLLTGAALVVVFGFGDVSFLPHVGTAIIVVGALWVLWPRATEDAGRDQPVDSRAGEIPARA